MENISLLVITDDVDYGRALGRALMQINDQLSVHIMDKDGFFRMRKRGSKDGGTSVSEKADLILWDGKEAEEAYGGKIILLSENPVRAVKDFSEKKFCIYKYSPAQVLVTSIFEIYSFLTGKRTAGINRSQVELLVFSSCAGGTGCTFLAMATGQELSRFRGKRIMYVSFEETESVGTFVDEHGGVKGAGVYLYHLFKNEWKYTTMPSESGYPLLDSYIIRDDFGIEVFAPAEGRNPLRELTDDELTLFIASLIDSGRYDTIIIDVGSHLSSLDISCMEMACRICLVSSGSGNGAREARYLQHLMRCCGERVVEKIVKTENMTFSGMEGNGRKEDRDSEGSGMLDTEVRVRRSGTAGISNGRTGKIFLEGGFGKDIKRLTERLTEITS